jgi:murein DD-endopeptidase MepM/ murein hydrolase activator NlpD
VHRITEFTTTSLGVAVDMEFPGERMLETGDCLATPHIFGRLALRPNINPVTESPLLSQDIHGCNYNLPGLDITSNNATAVLQAPMPGTVTTFTDQWQNSTIRIENQEWIVWLLHPRSYLMKEGEVERGQPVGIMGSVGFSTGPHVHYTVYDKVNETFVDPRLFLP